MGLLDDAIREHLELKRRHGADPEEVTRQEREALGAPVRGEFAKPAGEAPGEGAAPAAVAAGSQEPAGTPEPAEAEVADVPEFDEPPEMPGEPEPEPSERAAGRPPEPEPGDEEDPWLVEDLADPEPEPEPEQPAAPPAPPAPSAAADPAGGEDVLEETPEFLQETPEHDRLWFEQKPPRDFDWDK
jgi:hypothetical protein